MKTIGIDVGSLNIKTVVLGDEGILACNIIPSSDDVATCAKTAIEKTLNQAGLSRDSLPVVATGAGGKSFAQQKAITTCLARGVRYLFPSVRMAIDMGAESTTVIKVNERGRLAD